MTVVNIPTSASGYYENIVTQARQAQRVVNKMQMSPKLNPQGFVQPLGKVTGAASEFQKSMDASAARVFAFGAAVGIINAVSDAFTGLVQSAAEVEKSLKDVQVVMEATDSVMQKFGEGLFDVARNTATSFNLVADSAIELARQGLSAEETLARVNSALILSRLSGLDTVKSTESLTAAINSFNKEGITHEQIVNRMANVDAAFAVSSADLAEAISRAGAVAQASGVQFNELAAIVTAVQQRTARGGSVIGNGFKSIFTRIKRSRVREVLEEIGVATQNIDGSFRSSISILLDYAKTYNTLTDAQKAYTAEQIAGVFQIQNLQALIQDLNSEYSVYNNALGVANRTTDEATKRNQELNKTLDAIFKDTALSVKELGASLGNLALSGNFKEILTTLGSFAKTINDLFSEEEGSEFAKNLVKGISNFLTGPGLVLLGAAFIKIIALVGKFAKDAFKDLLGINLEAKRQESLQMAIGVALANNSTLYQKILAAGNNTAKQEQIVLNTIKQETAERIKQEALIKRIAASSALVGIGASEKGFVPAGNRRSRRVGKNTLGLAQGFLPAFAKESMDIRMGVGGARKTDKAVGTKIKMKPGQSSDVVVNTGEWIVKNYQNSGADAVFNRDMAKKYGLPEGAKKVNAASGLIPNFVNQAPSSKLRKSTKTVTYTASQLGATKDSGAKSKISKFSDLRDKFTGKVRVERMPQDNAYFAAKADSLKEKLIVRDPTVKDGSIKYKVDQGYKQLLQKQYKGLIDDGVYKGIFTSADKIAKQPAYSGEQPKRLKDLFRNLVGKSKGLVGESKARIYLRGKSGTEDVSFIKGNDPFDLSVRTSLPGGIKRTKKYEQKTKIEQNIAAVIKKGANSFLENLVNMQGSSGKEKIGIKNEIIDNINLTAGKEAMFRGGLNMLVAKDTKVSNRPLKAEGNLAGGFIPNFIDRRTRQQKIKDVLSDPANKGIKFNSPLSKPKTIETVKKGMGGEFQKMWIESYLKDGRTGDYQMLMKMGYNPDELLNLRKHFQRGGDVNIKTLSKGFIPNFNRSLGVKRSFAWKADGGKDWYTQFAGKSAEMKDFVNWAVQNKKLPQSQLNKLKQQVDNEASSYERSYWDEYKKIKSGDVSRTGRASFYGSSATSARPLPGDEKMRLNITNPKTKLFLKKDTMNELINEFKNSQRGGFVPSFATGGVITSKGLITTQQIRRLREGQYIKDKQTGKKIYLNQFEVEDQSAITGFKAKFSNESMQAKQAESRQKRNQLNTIDASRQATMLVATNNLRKKVDSTITPKGGQTTRLKYRVEGIKKANLKNTESKLRERMESLMINESQNLARELSGGQSFSANNSIVKNISNAGSIGSAAGAVFETAISSIGNNKLFTKNNATFDISGFPDPALKKLFGYYTPFADAKIGLGPDTKRDFNEKLLKLPEIQKTLNKDQTRQQGRTALSTRKAFGGFSGGYIPNFAGLSKKQKQFLVNKGLAKNHREAGKKFNKSDYERISGEAEIDVGSTMSSKQNTLGSRIRALQEKSGGIEKFLRFDNNPIILDMRKELKVFEREINKARVLGKDGLYGDELEAEIAKMVSALNERKKQIQETKIKIRESFFSSAGIAKESLAKKGKSNISFRDVSSASGGQFDYYFNQMSKGYIPSFSKYMPGVSRRKHGGFYSKSEISQIEKAKEKLNEGSGGIILRGGKIKDNNMPFGELKIEEIKLLERNLIKFGGLKQELAKKVADLYLKSYRSSGIKAISDPFLYNKKSLTAIENKYDPFMTSRSNAFAKGYIPGFANPIVEAVSRESSALRKRGIGENKIRLEQDNSLKNRMNPMGLAVTNKVDEPMGVAQGIKRAKKEGKDPKKYGMSKGYIPNFRRGLFNREDLSQGASMGISSLAFAGPLLQQQLFPEEPTSALGGAASGALTGASYGALLGLPGAAAGAGIGGAIGLIDKLAKDKSVDKAVSSLVNAQEKIKKEFKDIQALNAYKDGLIRLNTALEDGNQQEYINSQEQIKNALQDVSDPEIINRINKIADSNLKYSEKINLVTNAIEKAESRFDSFKKTIEFAQPSVQRESKQSPFMNFLSDVNPFFNSNFFERDVSSFGNDLAERRFKQTKSEENLGVRAQSTQRGVQLSEIIRERAKVTVDDLIEDLRSGGERSSQISLNLPEEFRNDASSMEIEEIKSNAKIMIALRREAAKFEQENIKEQIAILSSAGSQNVDSLRGLEDAREFLKGLSALEGLDLDTQEIISREILSSGTLLTASQQELAKTFKNLGAVIDGTNSGIEAINLETLKAQPRFKTAQEKARSILRQSARMSKAFSSIDQTLSFAASRIEESISLQKDYFSRVNEMATNIGIQGSEEGSRKRFEIERQAAEKSIANETQQNLIKTILSFAQPDSILDREEILNGLKDTSGESTSVISKEQKALRESFRKETSQITQGIYVLVDEYQKGSISMQELVKRSTEFATSQGGSDFGPASELSNKINQELIKSQKNLEDSIRRLTKEAAIEKLQRAEKTISEFGGRIFQAQELGALKETSARAGIDPITGPLLELKDSFETALSQNLKIDRFTATKASEAEAKLALRSQFSSVDLGAIGSTTAFDEKYNIAMANLQSLSGSLNDEVLSTIRQKVEQSFADQKQASLELQEFIKSEGMSGLSEEQSVVKASIDTAKNTSDMVAQLTTLTQSFGSFERTISGIASVLNSPTTAIQEQGSVAGLAAGGDQATQKIDQLSIIGSEVTESVLGLTEQMKVFSESLNTSLTEIPVKLREQLEEVVIKHTHQVSGNLNVEFNTSTLRATMGSVLFSELQNILTRPIVLETLTAALKSRGFLNLTD